MISLVWSLMVFLIVYFVIVFGGGPSWAAFGVSLLSGLLVIVAIEKRSR